MYWFIKKASSNIMIFKISFFKLTVGFERL